MCAAETVALWQRNSPLYKVQRKVKKCNRQSFLSKKTPYFSSFANRIRFFIPFRLHFRPLSCPEKANGDIGNCRNAVKKQRFP